MDSDGSRSITSSNDSLESYERVESTYSRTDVFDFPKVINDRLTSNNEQHLFPSILDAFWPKKKEGDIN